MTSLSDLPARFFAEQDRLRGALPAHLCAEDYVAEIAGFPRMDARGHAVFGAAFYEGFPDIGHTVDESLVAGDRIAVRFTLRGTHDGSFMGIPPSGRPVEVQAFVWMTVREGRVSRLQGLFDQMGLLRQIGAIA